MKECYECSQQNLKYKSDELDETRSIVDILQEKLIGIENELMSYKNGETDHSKSPYKSISIELVLFNK